MDNSREIICGAGSPRASLAHPSDLRVACVQARLRYGSLLSLINYIPAPIKQRVSRISKCTQTHEARCERDKCTPAGYLLRKRAGCDQLIIINLCLVEQNDECVCGLLFN